MRNASAKDLKRQDSDLVKDTFPSTQPMKASERIRGMFGVLDKLSLLMKKHHANIKDTSIIP
jgi:hypothetical protein